MSLLFCYYNVVPETRQLFEERRLAIVKILGKPLSFLSSEEGLRADGVTMVVRGRGERSALGTVRIPERRHVLKDPPPKIPSFRDELTIHEFRGTCKL